MNSDELRSEYLRFFESKGHTVIPSSSLIPQGDPTLLLTTAGMVQIKPYFMGEAVPPNRRLASCQKCFRTSDLESVGDPSHLTFFEMLGNFSVGDYFKKEAIPWAWEFVTDCLKLPKERLWVTIFLDDDEAQKIWMEQGVPSERIVRLGEKDNFWGPAGDSGPCGPCSEIHYDFGPEYGCGKPDCKPGCDCKRFMEIWNLVFTQFNEDREGKRTLLPRPNIDTGMGLERVCSVIQGKRTVYDTDIFAPLLQKVGDLCGKKYGQDAVADNAMRVVVEHSRSISFLISDGVMPSNEGRGYVLRRLVRRAAMFGRRLGLDKAFLTKTAASAIERMSPAYPELLQRRDFVLKVIEQEEARFSETLSTGLELIDTIMGAMKTSRMIAGKDVFRLYDTYGFPVELTKEIAGGRGFSIDREGFEAEMEKQREKARASHTFVNAASTRVNINVKASEFTGYEVISQDTKIVGLLVGEQTAEAIGEGEEAGVILAATPFYGEMGGQLGDTGEIVAPNGTFAVTDTVHMQDLIVHRGKMTTGSLKVGDSVKAVVEAERRLDIARNHTATHLLQAALRQVLGDDVEQRGSLVAPERFRFDFSHLVGMSPAEVEQVQSIINARIRQNLSVQTDVLAYKEALKRGATALFGEKYGENVRMVCISDFSTELCGGTHIKSTGQIGFFQVVGESSVGAGLRRIEAVTGRGAENYLAAKRAEIQTVAKTLGAEPDEVVEKADATVAQLKEANRRILSLEIELAKKTGEGLVEKAETFGSSKVLVARIPSMRVEAMRAMSDLLREKMPSSVIVLGTVYEDRPSFLAAVTQDLVDKGVNAGKIVGEVARIAGGGGGGKPTLGQAGGKDKSKVDDALAHASKIIRERHFA